MNKYLLYLYYWDFLMLLTITLFLTFSYLKL